MRAHEFAQGQQPVTISIPINITIPAGGGMPTIAAPASDDLPPQPVMVPPLQQDLELKKQQGGKVSKVINQIVSDDGAYSPDDGKKPDEDESILQPEPAVMGVYDLNEDFDYLSQQFARTLVERTDINHK